MKSKYKVGDYFYHRYWDGFWIAGIITAINNTGRDYTYPFYYYKILKSSKRNRYDDGCRPSFQLDSPVYTLSTKLSNVNDETILAVML